MVHGAPLWANTCRDVEHIVVPRDIIGSIRTSVVQHSRVMRPAAARLPRSNRPPEADAVLLPGSNRLGRRAATALPRRELPCVLVASARPNCRNRSPERQEPFAAHRRLRRSLPREPLRELRATGGCCCGSRAAPASGGRPSAQLLPREGGSCLGRAAFCPAPASGGRLLPREGGSYLGRTLKLGRGNRVAASVRSLARNRLPRQEPPAGAARAPQHPFGLEATAAPPPSGCWGGSARLLGRLLPGSGRQLPGRWAVAAAGAGQQPHGRTTPKQNLCVGPQEATLITLRMQAQTAARYEDVLAHVTLTGTGGKGSRQVPL